MRKSKILVVLITSMPGALPSLAQPQSVPADEWLLQNLGMRLSVQVSNPTKHPMAALAVVPTAKARFVAPNFPGREGVYAGNIFWPRRLMIWIAPVRPINFFFRFVWLPESKGKWTSTIRQN